MLLDTDDCLDLITIIEDERMISGDEAIYGRQAVLRGDLELTRLLKDRHMTGHKRVVATAIRELHDSLASPNPKSRASAREQEGGVALSSRPARNNYYFFGGRGKREVDGDVLGPGPQR